MSTVHVYIIPEVKTEQKAFGNALDLIPTMVCITYLHQKLKL